MQSLNRHEFAPVRLYSGDSSHPVARNEHVNVGLVDKQEEGGQYYQFLLTDVNSPQC